MLDSKKGHYDERLVATFGSMNSIRDLVNVIHDARYKCDGYTTMNEREIHSKIQRGLSNGLASYAKGFNKRNKYLTMTEYRTNVDEAGAPHVRAQVIPRGHTKTGKASSSLNRALCEQFNTDDNREAMRQWRAEEDKAIVTNVARSLREELGIVYDVAVEMHGPLELYRTGSKHSMPMKEYKAVKKAMDEHDGLLERSRQLELENINVTMNMKRRKEQIDERADAVDYCAKKLDVRRDKLNDRERQLNKREKIVDDKWQKAKQLQSDTLDTLEAGIRTLNGGPLMTDVEHAHPDGSVSKKRQDVTRSVADPQGAWRFGNKKGLALLLALLKQATEERLQAFKDDIEKRQEQRRQKQEHERRRREQEEHDRRDQHDYDDGPEL